MKTSSSDPTEITLVWIFLQALDYGSVKSLLSDTKTLRQILEEANSLLKMFWRAALPSSDGGSLQLHKVRLKLLEVLKKQQAVCLTADLMRMLLILIDYMFFFFHFKGTDLEGGDPVSATADL